jgi:hypothetical protein
MSTSRTRLSATALALACLAGAVSLTVSPGAATADPGAHDRDGAGRDVAELRRTLAPYRDVAAALADGFVPTEQCAASPAGAMGLHYVNPARLQAPADPAKPQILLYGKAADGSVELLGAEFFTPDGDQDLGTDGDRPSLFSQPFDGPMPGHEPGMPVHYDLHVWVGKANPAGVFSPWNPNVSC